MGSQEGGGVGSSAEELPLPPPPAECDAMNAFQATWRRHRLIITTSQSGAEQRPTGGGVEVMENLQMSRRHSETADICQKWNKFSSVIT